MLTICYRDASVSQIFDMLRSQYYNCAVNRVCSPFGYGMLSRWKPKPRRPELRVDRVDNLIFGFTGDNTRQAQVSNQAKGIVVNVERRPVLPSVLTLMSR